MFRVPGLFRVVFRSNGRFLTRNAKPETRNRSKESIKIHLIVRIQFVVDENGNVVDPKVTRGIGAGCDEVALEAIKKTKFEPGMQRGKAVPVRMTIPVLFSLR